MWERNIHQLPSVCAWLTRDSSHNLDVCPDRGLNLKPLGVWDHVPVSWATWPGLLGIFLFRTWLDILTSSFLVNATQFYSSQLSENFLKDFIYWFLVRGGGREEERERHINVWLPLAHPLLRTWPATQACALTGNWTSNPLVCRPASNPLSHTRQGCLSIFIGKTQQERIAGSKFKALSQSLRCVVIKIMLRTESDLYF